MYIIDNLEDIEVGDYLRIYSKSILGKEFTGEVIKFSDDYLIIGKKGRELGFGVQAIKKIPLKQEKRKLRYKKRTYNNDFIIWKLTKREVQKIKNEEMLGELEHD